MNRIQNRLVPQFVLNFLRWFCNPELLEDVEGDLLEIHNSRVGMNRYKANMFFTKDVLFLFRPGIIKSFSFNSLLINHNMLLNHITTALRQARRYKGYTLINLLGLVVGLTSSVLILLWVQDEVDKDKFHAKSDRIYQVWRNMYQANGDINTTPGIPQPLEHVLNKEYPDIDQVALISWEMERLIKRGEKSSFEPGRFASPDFFTFFSFPLIVGDPNSVLDDDYSIAISERLATKYFGENWHHENDVLGQTIKIDETQEFVIKGVFKNPGKDSSLDFDWILPAQEYIKRNSWVESWYNGGFRMYISLVETANIETVSDKVVQEINQHTNNEADERVYLQKFSETYLYSDFTDGRPAGGRIRYTQMLLIMAIFILVIASINYMNLFTAQAHRRIKEIGVRKIIGAPKSSLIIQFFVESFLMSLSSLVIALTVVFLTLPYFNHLTGKLLSLDFSDPYLWSGIAIITIITSLLSGSYPALTLPSFKVSNALKGGSKNSSSGVIFRNGMVVFQFALSFLLIAGTIVVSQQMDYILNKNLGLERENLVFVSMEGDLVSKRDAYKTALKEIPELKNITFTSGNPISYGSSTGGASWAGKNPDDVVEINVLSVGLDFIKTMGMEMEIGRDFSSKHSTDSSTFLVNQVLADIMGFENPLEQDLSVWGTTGNIIGVLKNFHMSSMYEPIMPLIVRYDPGITSVAFIRTQLNTVTAIKGIEKVTKALNPAYPVQYEFLDDDFRASYQSEMTLSTLTNIFAIVSIFISCLGLFGISSFSADQRSKEIGVRKVHGANVLKLVLLLSKDYARLMGVAIVIAAPIAYYYMELWLGKFAFKIDLNLTIFIIAGGLSFIVGALTVSYKSYRAAIVNPIRTLKEE